VWSFSTAYVVGAAVTAAALPFYGLARRQRAVSDPVEPSQPSSGSENGAREAGAAKGSAK